LNALEKKMNGVSFSQFVGWSTTLSGISSAIALVAIGIFFAGVQTFGPINDIAIGVMALTMVPAAIAIYTVQHSLSPAFALVGVFIGLIGMIGLVIFQTLLVLGKVKINSYAKVSEPTLVVSLIGFAAIGIWLIVVNLLRITENDIPSGLAWDGLVAGLGFLLFPVAYWRTSMMHPLTVILGMVWQIGYPIWAIWSGLNLLSAR
jgi:hypothetical protein